MRSVTSGFIRALAGCERDPPVAANPFVGTYTLTEVDGDAVPATQQTGTNETTEYLGGTAAIRADETYAVNIVRRVTVNGVETLPEGTFSGEYDRAGNAFDFHHVDGDFAGDVSGNGDLTIQIDGVSYTFSR
jgi:hypothetical protein